MLAYVQECRYSDDKSTINVNDEDVENKLRRVIVPKSTWKKFDCYCYSSLTDDLPVENKVVEACDLKARKILSFKKSRLLGGVEDEKKNS